MNAVKIMCCGAAAAGLAGQLMAMAPERRAALWSGLTIAMGPDGLSTKPKVADVRTAAPVTTPTSLPAAGLDAVVISPDAYGQFQTTVEIEGQRLPVLVDTGATFVCLSFEDADRLGVRPLPSDFRYVSSTANGRVAYAKTEIAEVRLGPIAVDHVTAFVAPRGALWRTLLGMNFLSKLRGFRIDDGRLVLQP